MEAASFVIVFMCNCSLVTAISQVVQLSFDFEDTPDQIKMPLAWEFWHMSMQNVANSLEQI